MRTICFCIFIVFIHKRRNEDEKTKGECLVLLYAKFETGGNVKKHQIRSCLVVVLFVED